MPLSTSLVRVDIYVAHQGWLLSLRDTHDKPDDAAQVPASRCDPAKENKGCSEKEVKYIAKMMKKFSGDKEKVTKELARLEGLKGNKMKDGLIGWVNKRIGILSKMKEMEL